MPVKLQLGVSKKLGQPRYGSLGANCQIEVELDSSLVAEENLAAFRAQTERIYTLCIEAVEDELARHASADASSAAVPRPRKGLPNASRSAQESCGATPSGAGRPATERQLRYLELLAVQCDDSGCDLAACLAHDRFGKPPAELASGEASQLIHVLEDLRSGRRELSDVLGDGSAELIDDA
jgi:hypothetical protein